jgi:ATP-dependent Clp protease protease subunit
MAMVDICRSSPKPIATVVMGKAMSAGAILLSCGWHGYRYAAPNSRIMIHDCLTATFGKAGEIIADADEVKRLNALLYQILDENCQKPSGYFVDQVHHRGHADWYLTPQDALEHNLVNPVKIPTLQVNLSTTYEFLG